MVGNRRSQTTRTSECDVALDAKRFKITMIFSTLTLAALFHLCSGIYVCVWAQYH